ncbi:MAG: 23S rRNA (pseudouridine(1915)-N(3))-methyltransferase RlmH [Clostridia bacterium]|nr:23S rRNA (pseudouridine(1915)-N(3))-methyltransferase RlmH [Clostridia bacterium]
MNLNIICVGRLKEQYLRDASAEYIKRMQTICRLTVTELSAEKLSDNPSQKEIDRALEAEGKKIIEKIPKGAAVFAMCIEGKQRSSEELSRELDELALTGVSNAVFIIGGSFGLSDEVKARSKYRLSMSKMTFPHQLARIMLLEQLYRAAQISLGTRYHK